jgi:hypothetical protein
MQGMHVPLVLDTVLQPTNSPSTVSCMISAFVCTSAYSLVLCHQNSFPVKNGLTIFENKVVVYS